MIPVILICEGGGRIGLGHVMRSVSIAECCVESAGFDVRFAVPAGDGTAARLIADMGFSVREWKNEPDAAPLDLESVLARETLKDGIVVVDTYRVKQAQIRKLQKQGCRVVLVDDFGDSEAAADLVVNANAGAGRLEYPKAGKALLGLKYALMRRSFRRESWEDVSFPNIAESLLVTFGGSDPGDWTAKTLEALREIDVPEMRFLSVDVIFGLSYRGRGLEVVKNWKGALPVPTVRTQVADLIPMMQGADMAVTAAGTTCFELARMGVPFLYALTVDNQKLNYEGFPDWKMGVPIADAAGENGKSLADTIVELAMNAEKREEVALAGKAAVDGQGACRVVEAMTGLVPVKK